MDLLRLILIKIQKVTFVIVSEVFSVNHRVFKIQYFLVFKVSIPPNILNAHFIGFVKCIIKKISAHSKYRMPSSNHGVNSSNWKIMNILDCFWEKSEKQLTSIKINQCFLFLNILLTVAANLLPLTKICIILMGG